MSVLFQREALHQIEAEGVALARDRKNASTGIVWPVSEASLSIRKLRAFQRQTLLAAKEDRGPSLMPYFFDTCHL